LVSEVISAAMKQDVAESDVIVTCPACGSPVPMHVALVTLTDRGSRYHCPHGCEPPTLLLEVQKRDAATWDVVARHGYGLTVKPSTTEAWRARRSNREK
jgi:hypothetical protein